MSGGDGGGKQASRGPGCTEPEPLGAGGGSWAEDLFGGEKGKAPRPPLNAASAAMSLACWLSCALLMQSRRRRGIPARRPIRSALSDSDAQVLSLDRPVQPAAAVHAEQGSTTLRHGRWFRPWRITEPVGPPARRLPGYFSPNNSERSFLRTVASRSTAVDLRANRSSQRGIRRVPAKRAKRQLHALFRVR